MKRGNRLRRFHQTYFSGQTQNNAVWSLEQPPAENGLYWNALFFAPILFNTKASLPLQIQEGQAAFEKKKNWQ
ncbi:hypothetical protein IM774_12045 [Erysipelotrichaceae bacterium RD49]|nr:hypothetical protein [Erysipelotrichaceae bacterium RD49]